jgi:GH18 family chitinase
MYGQGLRGSPTSNFRRLDKSMYSLARYRQGLTLFYLHFYFFSLLYYNMIYINTSFSLFTMMMLWSPHCLYKYHPRQYHHHHDRNRRIDDYSLILLSSMMMMTITTLRLPVSFAFIFVQYNNDEDKSIKKKNDTIPSHHTYDHHHDPTNNLPLDMKQQSHPHDFRIAGYLPDYRSRMNYFNESILYLDDLYLFSIEIPPEPIVSSSSSSSSQTGKHNLFDNICCLNPADHYTIVKQAYQHKKEYNAVKNRLQDTTTTNSTRDRAKEEQDLKVWLTIGGAGRSDHILNHPKKTLLRHVIEHVQQHSFITGIDWDYEVAHSTSYYQFLEYAALKLHRHDIQVSVTLHVQQTLPSYTNIDRINLMTYDLSNQEYHASFRLMKYGIQLLIKSGCPKSKIFVGIPLYGRHKHNFHQVKTFAELYDDIIQHRQEQQQQQQIVVLPRISRINEYNDYLFESQKTMQTKVKYAIQQQLGGIFFWEIGQDKHIYTIEAEEEEEEGIDNNNNTKVKKNTTILGGMLMYSAYQTKMKYYYYASQGEKKNNQTKQAMKRQQQEKSEL